MATAKGGIIPEEYAVEYVVDRVDTTATVWLGLTLGCARCHDHKYDPITQKEFYRLFAYFNNVPEKGSAHQIGNSPPTIPSPTPRAAGPPRRNSTRRLAAAEARPRRTCHASGSSRQLGATASADEGADWSVATACRAVRP